jgi:hypothetical protein
MLALPMKRLVTACLFASALGCQPTEYPPLTKTARLTGSLEAPPELRGDAWLFLFEAGQGFPSNPALPKYATAVSDTRRQSADARFIFAQVEPNPWRLWGFIDADGNFDPQIDVLSQPTAGDLLGEATEVNLQPGKELQASLSFSQRLDVDPPAFRLVQSTDDVTLDASPAQPLVLSVLADDAGGRLRVAHKGFVIGLRDSDHDGRPDDADGDGLPDLTLQGVLRFRPGPGQHREGVEVVIPLVLTNAVGIVQTITALRPNVVLARLDWLLLPQALERRTHPGEPDQISLLPLPPAGEYELLLLTTQGTLWRIPNALGATDTRQNVRFHFDRRGG